jgi:hypothetical protein
MKTKTKILSITPEQLAEIPRYVEKWTSIGLSTEPTDEEKGTAAIVKMYKMAGYKAPKVYWVDSPLTATLMAAGLCNRIGTKKFSQISLGIGNQMVYQIRDRVHDQVSDEVFAQALDLVSAPTRRRVAGNVLDYARDRILGQAMFSEADPLIKRQWYGWIPGGLGMAHACALYDFFTHTMFLNIGYEKWAGLISAAEQASFIFTFDDCAYAVRKMCKRSLDERWRLHCEYGPAALFNDGFSLYAWHGERLYVKEK